MSRDIQQQLQDCLDGFDGGLSPDECLSAYPRSTRDELEPLFRQALSLRVAYAASPTPEFRLRAREKLLFAAGRDVVQALASEPDPNFVSTTRQRLLNRAGAEAQEALRDVPPPRLPFWVNARRRLLETASTTPPKPEHRMPVGLRSALSAAVVVLAVAIAGAGFLLDNTPANTPTNTPSQTALQAEFNFISEQVANFEQRRQSGEAVSSSLLSDLAERTGNLAELYSADNPNSQLLGGLPDLIQRQQTLLAEEDSLDETVTNAQQRLDEADQKVAAANTDGTSPDPTETPVVAAASSPSPEPTSEPTNQPDEPDPTPEIPEVAIVTPDEVSPGRIVYQYDPSASLLGLRWWRLTTSTLTLLIPEAWALHDIRTDENDLAVLPTDHIFIVTDINDIWLVVSATTGEVSSIDPFLQLRDAGRGVQPADLETLSQLSENEADQASLYNMLLSIEMVEAGVAETETPAATGTATPTSTPTP